MNETLTSAKKNVSSSNSFTFLIAKYLIPSEKLPYFYCWYAYFRWVDDIADTGNTELSERKLFLSTQIRLVHQLYSITGFNNTLKNEELFVYELIEFDKRSGSKLEGNISDMLSCIMFDIDRIGQVMNDVRLISFFNLEVLSYLNTFQLFCSNQRTFVVITDSPEGNAGKWVHILRDFLKDIEEGLLNVTIEDIEKYGLIINNAHSYVGSLGYRQWVSQKLEAIKKQFKIGKLQLTEHPSLKYKILVILLCFKYQLYAIEIKHQKYILQLSYKIRTISFLFNLPYLIYEIILTILKHLFNIKHRINE
jgi:hypothetical protein